MPFLHFNSINHHELIEVLTSPKLRLLREDNPTETLQWQTFYSRLQVDSTESGMLKPYFDIRALMLSLYFLTSSKANVKAKYISQLYHGYQGPLMEWEDAPAKNSDSKLPKKND